MCHYDPMRTLLRRIRTALAVVFLPGDRTPVTRRDLAMFRIEWQEWQLTFNGILDKLGTWNARQAKREKRALAAPSGGASTEGTSASLPQDRAARKRALSRRLVAGGGVIPLKPEAAPSPDGEDDE